MIRTPLDALFWPDLIEEMNEVNTPFQIEKGIPIPQRSRRSGKVPIIRNTLNVMEVGDSVLVSPTRANSFYNAAKTLGAKVFLKAEGQMVRVWRTA